MTRSSLIKRIHTVANSELHLDDATYRTVLLACNDRGKSSCSDLTDNELELVLVALRRFSGSRAAAVTNGPQHNMIPHLMELLGWDWAATAKLCKRLTGWDNTKKCSAAELRKVLTVMIAMIEANHKSGKRTLSHTELFEFRKYTKRSRTAQEVQL